MCGWSLLGEKKRPHWLHVYVTWTDLTPSLTGKSRTRKNTSNPQGKGRRPGGLGGGRGQFARQNSRETRLSPLHESATAGLKPVIKRGRSASEYIPRSKGKDHLPEIPSMNLRSSGDRAASASGKGSSEAMKQTSPSKVSERSSPSHDPRSPQSDQSTPPVFSPELQPAGTEEALEASTDFARNVRGTSTPIDLSPDMTTNRSQTFNADHVQLNTSDANDRKPTDTVETIDTQQIELSVVDDDHASGVQSGSLSAGGTKTENSLPPQAQSQN